MRVWIDFSNSPHPLLFAPVVAHLERHGHIVLLTARDNAQTVELARERWPATEVIGTESPRARWAKAATLARRIEGLVGWVRTNRPDVALSHNSYAQIVAARVTRVPAVTAMDYEHQPANHLAFRLAERVLLPQAVDGQRVRRQGARPHKTFLYPGLKEELYLGHFEARPDVADAMRDGREVLVVARTPPTRALYHGPENRLFGEALRALDADPRAQLVVLARHSEQRRVLSGLGLRRAIVPERALDARSLMYAADLVLGAGGTMTREAALLGVPTYSVFAGGSAAVDVWLERRGMLRRLHSPRQLERVPPREREPRDPAELRRRSELLIGYFTAAVAA